MKIWIFVFMALLSACESEHAKRDRIMSADDYFKGCRQDKDGVIVCPGTPADYDEHGKKRGKSDEL